MVAQVHAKQGLNAVLRSVVYVYVAELLLEHLFTHSRGEGARKVSGRRKSGQSYDLSSEVVACCRWSLDRVTVVEISNTF